MCYFNTTVNPLTYNTLTKPQFRTIAVERTSRRAFTLIELLTVVAIIAILGAILIPAISSVRKNANLAKSTSNLREIGRSVSLYRLEHKDQFPMHRDPDNKIWIYQLWPYAHPGMEPIPLTASSGPEALRDTIFYTPLVEDDIKARAFGYNYIIDYTFANRLYGFSDSAKVALVADSKTSSSLSVNQINFRNDGKANVLFVDGHVELVTPERVPESHYSIFWRGESPE